MAAEGGDQEAFAQLVSRHQAPIFRFVRGLVRTRAEAEDVLQDTFLSVWRTVQGQTGGKKAGDSSVRAWLYTIARHTAYRRGRRRVGQPEHFEALDTLGARAGWGTEQSPEALLTVLQSKALVREALARLADEDREVLLLRDIEELSGAETAAALELSVPAMKSRLHRARLKLFAELRSTSSAHQQQEVGHEG